ncbi:leucine-rich repeat protein [Mycoplasma sp. Sp48II]|uniref:leucine-rich repeat protein n=1 Tax=Mycoplasma sp. Sp48II TaxID=3401682 RepID=UPI003AAC3EB5
MYIGFNAFSDAVNLKSINFPNVTYIGDYAFDRARNLETLNVPKLECLGKEALRNTPKLVEKPNIKQKTNYFDKCLIWGIFSLFAYLINLWLIYQKI